MTYRPLRDPIFLIGTFIYVLNRVLLNDSILDFNFFRYYLNDLLLVPCVLPPLLYTLQCAGVREKNKPPVAIELVACLMIWSIAFEIVGPWFLAHATPDFWDIVAYWTGGAVSWFFWRRYRNGQVLPGASIPTTGT